MTDKQKENLRALPETEAEAVGKLLEQTEGFGKRSEASAKRKKILTLMQSEDEGSELYQALKARLDSLPEESGLEAEEVWGNLPAWLKPMILYHGARKYLGDRAYAETHKKQ